MIATLPVKEDRSRILVILPRGETLRNFAYSGILEELRKQHYLILLSVFPNARLQSYLKTQCDHLIELQETTSPYYIRVLHSVLDLAHNRYLWSEAAQVRWAMRDFEAKNLKSKVSRFIYKLLGILFANNFWLLRLERLDLWLSQYNQEVKHFRRLISELCPALVFNGSHLSGKVLYPAYPIIQAAKLEGIKTAAFLFSWDNLTSQGRVIPPYDYYLAWNAKIKADFHRIYPHVKQENVLVSGTPQFVFHFQPEQIPARKAFMQQLGLQEQDRFILYSSGMSHHMPYEPEVVERIAAIIYSIDPALKLVVRTYAKDRDDVFEALKQRRPDIIIPPVAWEKNYYTPLPEDQPFFSGLLQHCEMGINVASTISLELCMFDKPAINIGYNPPGRDIYPYNYTRFYAFEHYKPIAESCAVAIAKDEAHLKALICRYLDDPTLDSSKRKELIEVFFEGLLGAHLSKSIADTISSLAEQPHAVAV